MATTQKLSDILSGSSLDEFFEDTLNKVKQQPSDLVFRETLFKLYCLKGYWEKAMVQLETWSLIDDHNDDKQLELYKNLVFSEILREEILKGKREPMTLQQELPEWMKSIWEANKLLIENKLDKSEALRLQAFENAPAVGGSGETIGDFAWMADNDSRLGPICEFIVAGGYRWVPFADIETINIVKPRDLLDLIWIHAQVKVKNDIFYGYIPARYPVRDTDSDKIKLGFETQWDQISEYFLTGKGGKMVITDMGEYPLSELNKVSMVMANTETENVG